ncbi:hypothetical protein CVT24_009286 [Panaeolus cyanescens]|uniref:Uncharacterized protein n=1 Tax=Panaeolus cyanescens TaxID=181874 RepID=A0A409Y889_9AGAR|nr:hypothetical protein CVT24_009286 [Panaeolus cyanescens]
MSSTESYREATILLNVALLAKALELSHSNPPQSEERQRWLDVNIDDMNNKHRQIIELLSPAMSSSLRTETIRLNLALRAKAYLLFDKVIPPLDCDNQR